MGQEHMMVGHTSKQHVTLLCQHILSSALYNHFPPYVQGTGTWYQVVSMEVVSHVSILMYETL